MNTVSALALLTTHFVGDFVCQSHQMSMNKSKSNKWLLYHVSVYTAVLAVGSSVLLADSNGFLTALTYAIGNGMAHFATDYFTSRWTSRLWLEKQIHNFFVVIGLDQLIHFYTLFLTYTMVTA